MVGSRVSFHLLLKGHTHKSLETSGLNWSIPKTDGETVGMTKNISQDRQRDETWTRDDLQNA